MIYQLYDSWIMRSPIFSLSYFEQLTQSVEIRDVDLLNKFLENEIFQDAIFLASPDLYHQINYWIRKDIKSQDRIDRLRNSLLKYFTRAASRATPFGLFSGCTIGNFEIKTAIEFNQTKKHRRTTELDMIVKEGLYFRLIKDPSIKSQLLFYPNNSLYRIGNHYRYIRFNNDNSKKEYHLTGVKYSDYLEMVLQKSIKGITIPDLTEEFSKLSISTEEANAYIDDLINEQILNSNLQIQITGANYLEVLLKELKKNHLNSVFYKKINGINKLLEEIDTREVNSSENYEKMFNQLSSLDIHFEKKYAIQTDLYINTKIATINNSIKKKLYQALTICNVFTNSKPRKGLSRFKEEFINRYGEEEVPLIEVLDGELSIGYGANKSENDYFLNSIPLPKKGKEIKKYEWREIDNLLLKMTYQCIKDREKILKLPNDIEKNRKPDWHDLPDTMSAIIEMVTIDGESKIVFEGASGSSAANILSRFGSGDDEIRTFVQKIVNDEKKMNSNQIIAEIIHLPQARVGNILKHPPYRDYEIPYLGESSVKKEKRIYVDDILVSIENNNIKLRSVSLNKYIIPRLTNAHNYEIDALPIYHFLCDIQHQNVRPHIGFKFHPIIEKFPFLPRVEFKGIILSKARWLINSNSINHIIKSKKDQFKKNAFIWVENLDLPKYIQLIEGDNKLLINSNNITCLRMLFATVKNKEFFILEEFLEPDEILSGIEDNNFCNEIVVSFYNDHKLHTL